MHCIVFVHVISVLCRWCVNEIRFFQFQFVNSFLSLFYIAFYLQDQARLKEVSIPPTLLFFCHLVSFFPTRKTSVSYSNIG